MIDRTAMFAPVWRTEGLDRLDLIDWDDIHDSVQAILQDMDGSVRQSCPGARISDGSNHSGAWSLFTYRVYAPAAESTVDPVVAGITFSAAEDGVSIRADLAGETGGDVLLDLPPRHAVGKLAVQEAARDVAEQLVKAGTRISGALRDAGREV